MQRSNAASKPPFRFVPRLREALRILCSTDHRVGLQEERWRAVAQARITVQRDALRHAERFQAALNSMLDGLCMFDAEARLIVCNTRYAEMYRLPRTLTQAGTSWTAIVAHRLRTIGYRDLTLEQVINERRWADHTTRESISTRHLGDGRTILIRHQPIKEGGWVAIHEDITERFQAQQRIEHMARHDALTGLANRASFHDKVEQAIGALHGGQTFALLCVDLDRFKEVNDTLGHAVGDGILKEIAARLKLCAGAPDTPARIGGDEFAIVHIGAIDEDALGVFASRVIEALDAPIDIDGRRVNIGASIGISRAPRDGAEGPSLLRMADVALYQAKGTGRGKYEIFRPEMDAQLQERRRMAVDLRSAIAEGRLEVHFQPIVDVRTTAIRSFEALARWPHPERGMISSAEFIPLAEQTGLIVELGEWILRAACREAVRWPEDVRLSVNVSVRQFDDARLVSTVAHVLRETGLSPGRLELEITESVMIDAAGDKVAILRNLRKLGVRIAMDDFGTGYSSLSYLTSFPFDKIKIDQSFVRSLGQRDSDEIVRMIANLGQLLQVATTAEGVETHAQLAYMLECGCDEAQGFLFSRPAPPDEIPTLLARFNGERSIPEPGAAPSTCRDDVRPVRRIA